MDKKRKFTYAERYAVWHCHGRRCWLCREPLRLEDATIDHFFPESLLKDDTRRRQVLAEYGLTDSFSINDFANWLPCHARCNQAKGSGTTGFIPGNAFVLQGLIKQAPEVERTARDVVSNATKDQVFRTLLAALEQKTIATADLQQLLGNLAEEPAPKAIPTTLFFSTADTGSIEVTWLGKDIASASATHVSIAQARSIATSDQIFLRGSFGPVSIGSAMTRSSSVHGA